MLDTAARVSAVVMNKILQCGKRYVPQLTKVQHEVGDEADAEALTPEASPLTEDPDRNKFPNRTAMSSSMLPVPVLLGIYLPKLDPTFEK